MSLAQSVFLTVSFSQFITIKAVAGWVGVVNNWLTLVVLKGHLCCATFSWQVSLESPGRLHDAVCVLDLSHDLFPS